MSTTQSDLFTIAPCPSPRMAWMAAHGIATHRTPLEPRDGKWPIEDEFGNDVYPWNATCNDIHMDGMTEDEALVALCKLLKLPLWNEPAAPFAGVKRTI